MNKLFNVLRMGWSGIRFGFRIFFEYFVWIRRYSSHPEKYPLELRYKRVRKICSWTLDLLHLDIKYNNLELLTKQKENYYCVFNHRHLTDPLYIIKVSERPVAFVAKKEIYKMPFLGRVLRAFDCVFLDRDDVMHQIKVFKDISKRLTTINQPFYIFSEGSRNKDRSSHTTNHYKDGSLKPAYWAKCKIMYGCLLGTETCFSPCKKGYKKRNVSVSFIDEIPYDKYENLPTTSVMPEIEQKTNLKLEEMFNDNNLRNKK